MMPTINYQIKDDLNKLKIIINCDFFLQVLGSPVLGDIQLSLIDRRGNLELEVIRARGLQTKAGSKLLPGV